MTEPGKSNVDRVKARLADWGITEIVDDYRGAKIRQTSTITSASTITHVKTRSSFTSECLDCGPAPHVSPDDHAVGVCLRCGRDKWL